MANQRHSRKNSSSSGASQSTKKVYASHRGISGFIERLHSAKTLYLLAGACQFFLGLSVVSISVLGLIRPFWLSAILTVIASVCVTTGIYFWYAGLAKIESNNLLRDAMRRIIEDQN